MICFVTYDIADRMFYRAHHAMGAGAREISKILIIIYYLDYYLVNRLVLWEKSMMGCQMGQ